MITTDAQIATLDGLIERIGQAYPRSEARADRAAGYIVSDQIEQIADSDEYMIAGQIAGWSNRRCTCDDDAHTDPRLGRLCAHRIAVMIVRSPTWAQAGQIDPLVDLLATPGAGEIVIDFYYDYTKPGQKHLDAWTAREIDGNGHAARQIAAGDYAPQARPLVTWEQFSRAIGATWGIKPDHQPMIASGAGFIYRWILTRRDAGGLEITYNKWRQKDTTEASRARHKAREDYVMELALQGNRILGGDPSIEIAKDAYRKRIELTGSGKLEL